MFISNYLTHLGNMKLDKKTMEYLTEMVDAGVFTSPEAAISYAVQSHYIMIMKIQRLHKKAKELPLK